MTKLIIQPGVGSLVLPAEDMSLQFYDAFHDRQIGEVRLYFLLYSFTLYGLFYFYDTIFLNIKVRVSTRNYVSIGGKTEECQKKESRSGPPVSKTY